jgi:hypothetical protein
MFSDTQRSLIAALTTLPLTLLIAAASFAAFGYIVV